MKLKTDMASPESPHDQPSRVKDLLVEALELSPSQRASFIAAATDGDPAIRGELQALLDAHERAGAFMQDPSWGAEIAPGNGAEQAPAEECGTMIGRYTLLRLIGEGGFGRVYLAEQREPVARTVALKIIKLGMDTRQVIARFEAERQALAMMDHPGIARVIDAGAAPGGRPYFVMELVHGVPITAYCDEHRLSIDQRLDLFSEVCAAVQHAHMKGIIHRDLKPSNILVGEADSRLTPKVIDFGIAKAVSGRLTDKTLVTEFRQLLGTPEYMSPEQAELDAADVDTRSDVYSLGVVLYELLTGSTPLKLERVRSASFAELQRMIREDEPEKPSTRLSSLDGPADVAKRRAIEPNRLASHLRGDLDWIALKAMEKDRRRRYASPAELAEDVRRHLAHEPVSAGPHSVAYRTRKFMRRHRVGVAAASVVAVIAIIGGVLVATSMLHARDAANQTAQINAFMTNMLTSVDPDRGKGADVRLVEVLREASTSASQWFAGHPELESQVRQVLGEAYDKLALHPLSAAEFKKAADLSEAFLGADHERTLRLRASHVTALANAGRSNEVAPILPSLTERIERVLGRTDEAWFAMQGISALQLSRRRQHVEAVAALESLVEQGRDAGLDEERQIGLLRGLVQAMWQQLEGTRGPAKGDIGERLEPAARQLAERSTRVLGPEAVMALYDQMSLARTLRERGKYQEAADMCIALLNTPDARLGPCHVVRKTARNVLSSALLRLDRAREAADLTLADMECERLESPLILVGHLYDALPILDRGGLWVEGERVARELVQLLGEMGGGHPALELGAEVAVARFVSLQGRVDEADGLFKAVIAREDEARGDAFVLARLHLAYGAHLASKALYADAEQHLQRAASALGEVRKGTWYIVPDDLIREFIALYRAWGKPERIPEYERLQYEALHPLEWTPSPDS